MRVLGLGISQKAGWERAGPMDGVSSCEFSLLLLDVRMAGWSHGGCMLLSSVGVGWRFGLPDEISKYLFFL